MAGAALLTALHVAHSFAVAVLERNHNEQMFVTAGILLSQGKSLYSDFAFLQMPLLAHVYGGLFRLTGGADALLAAKLFTWLVWLASAGIFYGASVLVTRDRPWSWAATALYLSSAPLLRTLHEASAYVLPAAASLAALACVLRALQVPKPWLFAAGGLLAGVATGAKAYHLVAALPLAVAAAAVPRGRARRRRVSAQLLPFVGGFAVASLPSLFYAARDFEVFWFDNFEFHRMTTARYASVGYDRAMDLPGKLGWIVDTQLSASAVGLAGLLLAAAVCAARGRAAERAAADGHTAAVSWLLLAIAGATAATMLAMTPTWPQYLALPVPYAILLVGALRRAAPPRARRALLGAAWLAVLAASPPAALARDLAHAADRRNWVSSRLEAGAAAIRRELDERGLVGRVATLQPLWPLAAGLPIYEELATGPFLFAVADGLAPERRARVVAAGPAALDELFATDPPAAVFTGIYAKKPFWGESALTDWARRHGYRAVPLPSFRRRAALYLAPPDAEP